MDLLTLIQRHSQFSLLIFLCLFTQSVFANLSDLKLENVTIGSTVIAGTPTTISFDLINNGTVAVTDAFTISLYLSDDTEWLAKDILIEEIIQPGQPIGVSTLTRELLIPDLRGGKFYLIFQVDKTEIVVESNELNNEFIYPIEVTEVESEVDCSFVQPISVDFFVQETPTVAEQADGYDIYLPQNSGFNSPEAEVGVLSIDVYGNVMNYDIVTTSHPTVPNYSITYNFGASELFFKYTTTEEEVVFDKLIPLNGSNPPSGMIDDFVKVVSFQDGYLLIGSYEYQVGTNGRGYEFFSIRTDQEGNVTSENYFEGITSHHRTSQVIPAEDGSLLLWTKSLVGFDHIFKIDQNGNVDFHTGAVAGSTGSWLNELRLSPNDDYLWGRIGSNNGDRLLRVDTETGTTTIEFLWDILSVDSPQGDDFFTGLNFDKDGNVLIGYHLYEWANDPFIGFEFGLISPDYEIIWEHRIEENSSFPRLHPLGEVSNGYLFLASRLSEDGGYLIKVAADGTLTTECEEEPVFSGPLGCNLNYTFLNNQLILGGDGLNAAHVKIKVFDGNYNFLKLCFDCGNTIDLPNFDTEELIIDILLMDESWTPICESFETISVEGTSTPCTDLDNDGVCADQDCDDNNPQLPATPGSACDDGNSNTENDIIQEDGCSCAGTIIVVSDCDFTVNATNGGVTIAGLTDVDRSKIFTDDFEVAWRCDPWNGSPCSSFESITDLEVGATYFVSIKTASGDCEEWIEVVISGNGNTDQADLTGSNLTYAGATTVAPGDLLNFEFDAANIGTATAGSFTIKSYISTNPTFDASDVQDGTIPTGNWVPGFTISGLAGALTVPNLSSGNYYLIVSLDADEEINESSESNNVIVSSTPFTIEGMTPDCTTALLGFSHIGTYNGHNYFYSEEINSWIGAKAIADNIPGAYLATINDAEENEFVRAFLDEENEKAFIGYQDQDGDGTYGWDNGESVTYSNPLEVLDQPYVHLQFWDGKWSSDGDFKFRHFVLEIPCSAAAQSASVHNNSTTIQPAKRFAINKLYPNPVASEFTNTITAIVTATEAEAVEVHLYDQLGKEWSHKSYSLTKGINQLEFSINHLSKGVYMLMFTNKNGLRETMRFVKF